MIFETRFDVPRNNWESRGSAGFFFAGERDLNKVLIDWLFIVTFLLVLLLNDCS